MGSPYESFGDDRIALIVDLEPTVVHEPRPRALDDPPSWGGSTSKRWSWILFTTSAEMWCAPHEETKVFLKPPSHQIFFSRLVWLLARSTAGTDLLLFLWRQPHRDELGERRAILVEDPERTVAGVGHRQRLVDDVAKQDREIQVGLHQERCLKDSSQLGWILDGTVRH
jgi:hypothetical protein